MVRIVGGGWLLLTLASPDAQAQGNPGTNLTVAVDVVSLTMSGDTTRVSYVARNSAASREPLWTFTVEAPTSPVSIDTPMPADSWAVFNSYGERPVAHWAWLTGSMAAPGAQSPTLSFRAIGLPAIVDAHAEGYYDLPEGEDDPVTYDPLKDNAVQLKVVGVEPVPAGTTPAQLTNRLENLTRQACALGWIRQPSLCTTLGQHLSAQPARLSSFRSDLAAGHLRGGPVNDNAFWLLKINAEYILGLPRQQRKSR